MSADGHLERVAVGPLTALARRSESRPSPTAVMLHGYGGDENVMWIFSAAFPPAWTLLAVRGIEPAAEGGFRWHVGRRWPPPDAAVFAPAVEALRLGLPGGDVLWVGFSQGAALALCCAAAGLPASGVVCLAGFLPPGLEALRSDLPVFWSHGTRDDKVPVESARAAARTLESWGVDLDYCETDAGHKVGAECLRALRRWIDRYPGEV